MRNLLIRLLYWLSAWCETRAVGLDTRFQVLRQDADAAIGEAERSNLTDSVNWARVRCCETRLSRDVTGAECWQAFIAGADPTAYRFREFVTDYVKAHGWQNVEVYTEW